MIQNQLQLIHSDLNTPCNSLDETKFITIFRDKYKKKNYEYEEKRINSIRL